MSYIDVWSQLGVATVTSGGTTAPAAGTQESWTVTGAVSTPYASTHSPTVFRVVDAAGPTASGGVPTEIMLIVNVAGATWTAIRGAEGTTPVAHSPNWVAEVVDTIGSLQNKITAALPDYPVTGVYNTSKIIDVLNSGPLASGATTMSVKVQAARTGYNPGDVLYLTNGTNGVLCQVASTQTPVLPGATHLSIGIKAFGAADGTGPTWGFGNFTVGNITIYNMTQGDFLAAYTAAESNAMALYPNGCLLRVNETGNVATTGAVIPQTGFVPAGVRINPFGFIASTSIQKNAAQGIGTWLIEMPGTNANGTTNVQLLPSSSWSTQAGTNAALAGLQTALTAGTSTAALQVGPTNTVVTIPANTVIQLAYGGVWQRVVTTAMVNTSTTADTTIPVTAFLPLASFPTGAPSVGGTIVSTPTGWAQQETLSGAIQASTGTTYPSGAMGPGFTTATTSDITVTSGVTGTSGQSTVTFSTNPGLLAAAGNGISDTGGAIPANTVITGWNASTLTATLSAALTGNINTPTVPDTITIAGVWVDSAGNVNLHFAAGVIPAAAVPVLQALVATGANLPLKVGATAATGGSGGTNSAWTLAGGGAGTAGGANGTQTIGKITGVASSSLITATTIIYAPATAPTGYCNNSHSVTVLLPWCQAPVVATKGPFDIGDHVLVSSRPCPVTGFEPVVGMVCLAEAPTGSTSLVLAVTGPGTALASWGPQIAAGSTVQNMTQGAALLSFNNDGAGVDGLNVTAYNAARSVLLQGYKTRSRGGSQWSGGVVCGTDSNPYNPWTVGGQACNQFHFEDLYLEGNADSASVCLNAQGFDWEGHQIVSQQGVKYWNCGGVQIGVFHSTGGTPNTIWFQPLDGAMQYLDSTPAYSFAHTVNSLLASTDNASNVQLAAVRWYQNTNGTNCPAIWNTLNDAHAWQTLSVIDPTATFTLTASGVYLGLVATVPSAVGLCLGAALSAGTNPTVTLAATPAGPLTIPSGTALTVEANTLTTSASVTTSTTATTTVTTTGTTASYTLGQSIGVTTASIAANPSKTAIQAALTALPTVGSATQGQGSATVTVNNVYVVQRGNGVYEVQWTGALARWLSMPLTATLGTGTTAPAVLPIATQVPQGGLNPGSYQVTVGANNAFTYFIENPSQFDYPGIGVAGAWNSTGSGYGGSCFTGGLYKQVPTAFGGTGLAAPGAELPMLLDGVPYYSGGKGTPWGAAHGITSGALPTVSLTSGTGAVIDAANDRRIAVPVTFTPTSGAAATCAIAVSPDGTTYTTLTTKTVPAGTALDSFIDMVELTVPAGWRLKLTATNATIGTASYY